MVHAVDVRRIAELLPIDRLRQSLVAGVAEATAALA